jgi:hypothetical protein
MSAWRESTSPQAQVDLDQLVSAALGMAQQLLGANHEFFPFAAAITTGGAVEFVAGRGPDDGDDQPAADVLLASCESILRLRRDQLRAAGLTADVRTADGEAIQVDVEHVEGAALRVLLPYTRHRLGRVKEYGELSASMGVPRVWTDGQR